MKIYFETVLSKDDMENLEEEFNSVEYTTKENIHIWDLEYYEVAVDTIDLIMLDADMWLKPWLEAWFILSYSKEDFRFYLK